MVARSQKSAPPSTQRCAGPHERLFVHCVLLTHSTQALPATSQCSPFGQFASVRQRTQKCVVVLQTLFAPAQSPLPVQPPTAHRCLAVSHIWLAAQSVVIRHSTHVCVTVSQRS